QVVNDLKRIFGFESLAIEKMAGRGLLQAFVDDHPYRLDELGSGISQFLIVLMNAAARASDYILIDEPELSLHPALQIEFVNALQAYWKKGGVFATHSLGLASTLASRVYVVSRRARVSRLEPLEQVGGIGELLRSMTYSPFEQVGYDRLCLVEGVTDVPV